DLTIVYNTWSSVALAPAIGGALRYAANTDASIYFDFTGTQFTWITLRGPLLGKAEVYVDGVLQGTVNLYNSGWQVQFKQVFGGLADGPHTARIRVLGVKDPRSRGTIIPVDGFSLP
ncbi:MAG: hypothetical protein HY784_17245, partial [Chloroflexi bacterium]|nr:hypothetical protein [Chloroflexota bacterium]